MAVSLMQLQAMIAIEEWYEWLMEDWYESDGRWIGG
jgi:hypothetical protein